MQAGYMQPHAVSIPFSSTPVEEGLREAVYVVDRDRSLRNELSDMLAAVNVETFGFATATDYLGFTRKDSAACLILDTHLPDMTGLDLQRRLAEKTSPPVIFVSALCDIAATVCAMKAGAVEFLTKPVDRVPLMAAVQTAFALDRKMRQRKAAMQELLHRYARLTPREREVLPLVVGGLLNKQAACVLAISEVTLQIHRSQVMRKMEAESFAELVRMAVKLRIPHGSEWCARRDSNSRPSGS